MSSSARLRKAFASSIRSRASREGAIALMPTSNNSTSIPEGTRTRIRPWLAPVSLSQQQSSTTSSTTTTTPTPSTSTSSFQDDLLRLQVLDVTATAVALSVFTPQSTTSSPSISIQLNGEPWPHVAHALAMGGGGNETTVIVYGLEQGKEYEIGLDVVGRDEDGDLSVLGADGESDPNVSRQSDELDRSSSSLNEHPHSHTSSTTIHATTLPSHDAPPPYSPSSPLPPTEPQLRALLKKLRANSKRTESVLNSSISSLKKSVEKGIKEDQRARSRIVSLEDGIRKAHETEVNMRGSELDSVLSSIEELEVSEKEVALELEGRKSGKIASTVVKEKEREKEKEKEKEPEEEREEDLPGIAELAKELDTINKQIDLLENERRGKVKDVLRGLEMELGQIEGELIAMDREEQHRYNMAARMSMSNESLPHIQHPLAHPHPPQQPPQASGSNLSNAFALKWGRNRPTQQAPPAAPAPPSSAAGASNRSFGQFFRRSQQNQIQGTDLGGLPHISAPLYGTGSFLPPAVAARQQFAQEQQAQALWGLSNGSSGKLISGIGLGASSRNSLDLSTTNSRGDGSSLDGRPRSTSLNSAARPFVATPPAAPPSSSQPPRSTIHPRGVSSPIPIIGALPSTSPSDTSSLPPAASPASATASTSTTEEKVMKKKKSKGKEKDKSEEGQVRPGSSASSKESGASWGRIGTWSQVVGRGGKKKGKGEEEEEGSGVKGDETPTQEAIGDAVKTDT